MNTKTLMLYPEQIEVVPGFNVRFDMGDMTGLQKSIKENGVKLPLIVRKTNRKTTDNYPIYELVDGHRRLKAATAVAAVQAKAGEEMIQVPAYLEDATAKEDDNIITMLVTGEGQQKLNMLEVAEGVKRLSELGWKNSDIAKAIGKTQSHVDDCLVIIKRATKSIYSQIKSGTLSASAAVEILKAMPADEAETHINKAVSDKGGKKVTTKDVAKAAGKAVTKKSASAGKAFKKAADETKGSGKPKNTVEFSDEATKLEDFKTALEAQDGMKQIPAAFKVLDGLIGFLNGTKEPIDLAPLFFEGGTVPAKKSLKQQLDEIDTDEKPTKKTAAKKSAPAAPAKPDPKPSKKPSKPAEDLDDDDDLDAAINKDMNKGKAAAKSLDLDEDIDDLDDL